MRSMTPLQWGPKRWGLGSEQVWWEEVTLLTWQPTSPPTSLPLLCSLPTLLSLLLRPIGRSKALGFTVDWVGCEMKEANAMICHVCWSFKQWLFLVEDNKILNNSKKNNCKKTYHNYVINSWIPLTPYGCAVVCQSSTLYPYLWHLFWKHHG